MKTILRHNRNIYIKVTDYVINNYSKDYNTKGGKMEYEKVEDTIFKFENVGDKLEGKLVGVEDGQTYGNKVYKIETEDKKILTVFGTSVLMTKMSTIKLGDQIMIEFAEVKPSEKKGFNDTKMFNVYRAK